ncbi:MAG: hypothetical protein J6M65_12505 [Eubacterium sp.]|nr:hypothetical protein [Eubacterium sp.]
MLNQLKIDSYKMKRFIPFYICIGIMIVLTIDGMVTGLKQSYIDFWHVGNMHDGFIDSVQDCSFSFLYGMLISWYVGIDFTNRTLHRAIVTGNKRWTMVVSRIMAVSVLTFIIHVFLIISQIATFGKTFGYSFEGFGPRDLVWLGVVALQILAFSSFYVLISVICGNVYSGIFTCVIISTVAGNVLRNVFGGNYIYEHSFFCFAKSAAASDLIPCSICAIIFAVIITVVTIIIFNKKDVAN